jgi:hypothetical protein
MATSHAARARWGKDVRGGGSSPQSEDVCAALTGPESAGRGQGPAPSLANAESSDALESVKLLIAGGFAGAVSKTATAPLARLTILYQVSQRTSTEYLEDGKGDLPVS